MSKINKEDRNIVILIIIFLLLLSVYFIYNLLNPSPIKENKNEVLSDYEILNAEEYFKLYEIREDLTNRFNIFIDDIRFKYENNILSIDDKVISDNIVLNGKIGLYDCLFVFLGDNTTTGSVNIIIYDRITKDYNIIDNIDGMYLYDLDNSGMAEAGLRINLTRRYNNNIIVKDKEYDICTYKDNKLAESMQVIYLYDIDKAIFTKYDIITKKTIGEAKKELCN